MNSQRRGAQLGLILACFTLVTTLTILFRGSYGSTNGEPRVGTVAKGTADGENSPAHVKMAAMGK